MGLSGKTGQYASATLCGFKKQDGLAVIAVGQRLTDQLAFFQLLNGLNAALECVLQGRH